MILTNVKGLRRHGDLLTTSLTVLYLLEWVFLFGQLNGFYHQKSGSSKGSLNTNEYVWDVGSIMFIALFWCSWLLSMFLITSSKECREFKIGGVIGYSLLAAASINALYHAIFISGFVPDCLLVTCVDEASGAGIRNEMWP